MKFSIHLNSFELACIRNVYKILQQFTLFSLYIMERERDAHYIDFLSILITGTVPVNKRSRSKIVVAGVYTYCKLYKYSKTSMTRTPMARLS